MTGRVPVPFDKPPADPASRPFWDAALEGRLMGSRCTKCGTVLLPPQPYCFECQNNEFEWVDLPGTGTIYTYTVVRHPLAPHLEDVVPYVSGVVELDGTQGAGCRMIVNFVDVDPDNVKIGDKVKVVFERVSDEFAMPRFTLA